MICIMMIRFKEVNMARLNELELAKLFANMASNGFSVYAQYDLSQEDEVFKGLIIAPGNREASLYLRRVAELITNTKGLYTKENE